MSSPLTAGENATTASPTGAISSLLVSTESDIVPKPPPSNNNSGSSNQSRKSMNVTNLSPSNMKVRKTGIEFRYTDSARDRSAMWQLVNETQREDYEGSEISESERIPLLPKVDMKRVQIAATFLRDYEHGRVPVFRRALFMQGGSGACGYSVSDVQLVLYKVRFHWLWEILRFGAVLLLFLASVFDRPGDSDYIHSEEKLHSACILVSFFVLLVELAVMKFLGKAPQYISARALSNPTSSSSSLDGRAVQNLEADHHNSHQFIHHAHEKFVEIRGAARWANPVLVFAIVMTLDTIISVMFLKPRTLWIGICKPLVLFYVYPQARDGLEALLKVLPDAICVIFMELFIIYMFSAVAVCLYGNFEEFEHIEQSFISMFKLSTTVVNPSIWMAVYDEHRKSAFFFVIFGITTIFYLHSLVLSTVFQNYIGAMSPIMSQYQRYKEESLRHAFQCLEHQVHITDAAGEHLRVIDAALIRGAFQILRPHYNVTKINYLVGIVDPSNVGYVGFDSFRDNIPLALNSIVRTGRTTKVSFDFFSVFVAVLNLLYATFLASETNTEGLERHSASLGCMITFMCLVELISRTDIMKMLGYTKMGRTNRGFDAISVIATIVSTIGMIQLCFESSNHTRDFSADWTDPGRNWIYVGRVIDMIRCLNLRFFPIIFQKVVKRTGEVIPALMGPVILVYSAVHLYTYVGMMLFGGKISVGETEDITPLYDLNNFNSYAEGVVTMYQVLVINDWHEIAEVFLGVSNSFTVYTFFISGNLFAVCILLNVMISFFVGALTMKQHDDNENNQPAAHNDDSERDSAGENDDFLLDGETGRFDIFEREGHFDDIVKAVAGDCDQQKEVARACEVLSLFVSMMPDKNEQVGFLVSSQHSMDRFGNKTFAQLVKAFVDESMFHEMISEMQSELLSSSAPSIQREFASLDETKRMKLQINVSSFSDEGSLCLFTARQFPIKNEETSFSIPR